ncbi:MAG: hypothetical protein LBG11_01400 [Bifidobacteriaceae bacterium]|jgi:bifunctional DNA-binding transcriptional regulator/antitoxin component of YhaV-PrlF toxin-antitoxin module|nr:hypothetical protein [Bifidobacteriaceae bacterium]
MSESDTKPRAEIAPAFASISARGTISLPAAMRRRLRLDQPGAQVEISLREEDSVVELRPHVAVPVDQFWYWTPEWQAGEREADEQESRGEGVFLKDGDALLKWFTER